MISNERYFARRAVQEASRAARACSPSARQWHQELADKFRLLASGTADADQDERVLATA